MIEVQHLSKRYGDSLAVDDLSFTVAPGRVTGFLGPNGSGKSTTMRAIVNLDRPTAGWVRVNRRHYTSYPAPLREIGALLDAKHAHPGRSGYDHLLYLAQSNGISRRRVEHVLGVVGLESVAGKRAKTYSLGMGQRLGIAAALLGDPATLLFDEPVNGLDPEGIVWLRSMLKAFAAEGRAVLISSHLISEIALAAQHLVVIGRGKLIADTDIADFLRSASGDTVLVRTDNAPALTSEVISRGGDVTSGPDGAVLVTGLDTAEIAQAAAQRGALLYELTPQRASLEDAFMELTADAVEFSTSDSTFSTQTKGALT
jgi:ABC-2 type transport system ATP-binding protein